MDTQSDEILRLRTRLHNIEKTAVALELLVRESRARMETMEQILRKLSDEDRIADEVAKRIAARRAQMFSWPVKITAFSVGVIAVLEGGWRFYVIVTGGG